MKKVFVFSILVLFIGSLLALESGPSEVVGFVKYPTVNNSLGDYNFMAIPMDAGYAVASDLGADYPLITSIKAWDEVNQIWVSSNNYVTMWYPDNPIDPNQAYFVTVDSGFDLYIAGGMHSAPPVYNFVSNSLGDYNTMMLHFNQHALTTTTLLGDNIMNTSSEVVCTSIREWDQITQIWVSSNNYTTIWYPEFAVDTGMPYYITVSEDVTWPVRDSRFEAPSKSSSSRFEAPSKSTGLKPSRVK